MGTLNNGSQGKGNQGAKHDGQKNYQHSNQRNPDNIRNSTRDHEYNVNFEGGTPVNGEPDYDDTQQNVDKHTPGE